MGGGPRQGLTRASLALGLTLLCGCRSILNPGWHKEVRLESEPAGAVASVYRAARLGDFSKCSELERDGERPVEIATTPAQVHLWRRSSYIVEYELNGATRASPICHSMGVFGASIMLFVPLGLLYTPFAVFDYLTGADYDLSDERATGRFDEQPSDSVWCPKAYRILPKRLSRKEPTPCPTP